MIESESERKEIEGRKKRDRVKGSAGEILYTLARKVNSLEHELADEKEGEA